MDVLCIIPARANSVRVPGKNKLIIGGKHCIEYAIEHAQSSKYNPHVLVISDDDETLDIAKRAGAEVLIEPDYCAKNDDLYHVLDYALGVAESQYGPYGVVALLYPNVVLRPPGIFDRAIDKLITTGCDVVGSVYLVPTRHHPFYLSQLAPDGRSIRWWPGTQFMMSQDFPPMYCDAAASHVVKRTSFDLVWKDRGKGPKGISHCVICDTPTVDIDTPEDVAWAEFRMMCHRPSVELADSRERFAGMS